MDTSPSIACSKNEIAPDLGDRGRICPSFRGPENWGGQSELPSSTNSSSTFDRILFISMRFYNLWCWLSSSKCSQLTTAAHRVGWARASPTFDDNLKRIWFINDKLKWRAICWKQAVIGGTSSSVPD